MQVTAELVELYQNGALGWVAHMALNPKYGGQADTARDGLDPVQIRGAIERRMASRAETASLRRESNFAC